MELLGGQAIIEGVLIHYRKKVAVAIRKPDGKIFTKREEVPFRSSKVPFLRGVVNLFVMLYVGVKMLNLSSAIALGDEKGTKGEMKMGEFIGLLAFSLVFGIILFKVIPLGVATLANRVWNLQGWTFSLVDGVARVALFVGYVWAISFFPDVKRLFQYHGAEHAAVACHEAGKKLTVENVQEFPTAHRRCGTAFIFLVFLVSVFVYAFIPQQVSFLAKLLLRLVLLPGIAGVSYEILRLGAKSKLFTPLVLPGLWIQKITTQKPDGKQVEVAIAAVRTALRTA